MQHSLTITGLVLLCILLAFAGCTGSQNPPAAPSGTVPPAAQTGTMAPAAGPDLVPSPTDTMVEANRINVNVEKDYLAEVTVTFQGGSGLQQVNKIDVTLNRADGGITKKEVGIRVDDSITLQGTKDTDRIIVHVTMKDGRTYKIIDSLLPYRTRQ
jgi:hypothetical protein